MSHIKGYLQFISEQNQGDINAAEIKKKKDIIKGLRNKPGNATQIKTIERLEQEIQDLKAEAAANTDAKPAANPTTTTVTTPAARDNAKFKAVGQRLPAARDNAKFKAVDTATTTVVEPAAKKQEPFQMSSGRGNEALRARNIAKAKARKQNPTVNTKPTLNKAGTDSGSGVDALKQRMIKRSEERGK